MINYVVPLSGAILYCIGFFGCNSTKIEQPSVDYKEVNSSKDTAKPDASKKEPEKRSDDSKSDDKKSNAPEERKLPATGILALTAYLNPARPQDEVYLGDWRILSCPLDDEARRLGGFLNTMTNWEGNAYIDIPSVSWSNAMNVWAYNDVLGFACHDERALGELGICRIYEIFVPPFCFEKIPFIIGPLEDAVWRYYRNAAMRHGEGFNTSQVDCATWVASMRALYATDRITDELQHVTEFRPFNYEVLLQTLRENQEILVPTRPPICMAEQRHDGGTMKAGEPLSLPFILGEGVTPCTLEENSVGFDLISIGTNAIVNDICGIGFTGQLKVNNANFNPNDSSRLQDRDFLGIVSQQRHTVPNIDVTFYNTQLGNGRPLDSDIYKNACALTNVVRFDNTSDNAQTIAADVTGVIYTNLFGDGQNTAVFLTSDGDKTVSEDDYWVIFYETGAAPCSERVIAVELLGHRRGDFRDNLIMKYDAATEDLFLGLRADYVVDGALADGNKAFFSYTIHTWDGSSLENLRKERQQFATCYLASDDWAKQFFRLNPTEHLHDINNANCASQCPLEDAVYAVYSQCFSNSTANQRWQNYRAGYSSMNSIKNVTGNIIINPGWLGPNLDVEILVQKFDQPVFHGPHTIRRTDEVGQLMVELPTLVEGDRVLIKAEQSCCSDYDLIIPCVPQFTGFAGHVSVPYIPVKMPGISIP